MLTPQNRRQALTLDDLDRYIVGRARRDPDFGRAVRAAQQQQLMRRLLAGETIGPDTAPAVARRRA